MSLKIREVYYFQRPGEENTDLVMKAVTKYVERSGIRDVMVATSGVTALKFARALKDEAGIICVSESPFRREWGCEYPCMDQKIKNELESLGAIVLDKVPYVLHSPLY
ncbi:MAG: hypothetical protein ACUVQ5_05225 [Candidatus Methanomethylicaceae archaeon]